MTAFLYFVLLFITAAFGTDIVIASILLLSSVTLFILKNGNENRKRHIYIAVLFAVSVIINPLFNHRGVTPLFVVNDNPITLEAFLYGVCMAGTFCGVIYMFFVFSSVMTSDKLIYVFGILSPKIALLLSMALRYVPLFINQQRKVKQTQKALGLYKDGNFVDLFRGNIRVFSVMVTWALENGIITADSMAARGYSEKKRTPFSFYVFDRKDAVFLVASVSLFASVITGKIRGIIGTVFYPEFVCAGLNIESVFVYLCFALFSCAPIILEVGERTKWKYLMSKI
jgi:energy-coupling factor transport system permease protein